MSQETTPSVFRRQSFKPRSRPRLPSSHTSPVLPHLSVPASKGPSFDTPTSDTEAINVTLSSPPMIKPTQRREVVEVNVPATRWRSRDLWQKGEAKTRDAEVSDSSEEVIVGRGRPEIGSWRSRPIETKSRPVSLQSIRRPIEIKHTTSVSPTTKTHPSTTSNDPTPRATPAQTESKHSTTRRASVPIALASFPHASVPSIPHTQMPDLNRIRPIAPYRVAEQLLLTEPCQLPRTKEFALAPPPYSDTDIPPPEPYNEAYPHPLTSYASPGVNPNAVLLSGYDLDLAELMKTDRARALGTILATCDRPGITAPTLAKHLRSYIPDGNGIPGFDNEGAARAALGPIGAAMCRGDERLSELTGGGGSGIQPVFTPAISHVPPRHAAQAQSRMETRMREPRVLSIPMPTVSGGSGYEYDPMTPPLSPGYERRSSVASQQSDYFAIPAHPAVIRRASTISAYSDDRQYSTINPVDGQHLYSPVPKAYNTSLATSPWYKTELCPAHQESGQCRYGVGCQFAHGLQELRLGLGRMPYPEMQEEQSIPTIDPIPSAPIPKIDIRRASAPHSQLPTVTEVDDDHYYHNLNAHNSGRRSSEATEVPHSGYERFIRSDSIARLSIPRDASSRDLSSSMSSDMPWTPTQLLSSQSTSARPMYGQNLHTRASDSSLSFTSSAAYSPKADSENDDTPTGQYTAYPLNAGTRRPPSSPSSNDREAGSGSASSWGSRSPGQAAGGNTTSATVDFSAGRSIWC